MAEQYNKKKSTKIINEHQRIQYENMEKEISKGLLLEFDDILSKYKNNNSIKILDIGGASGNFALTVKEYFAGINCEVIVIDNTKFETWTEFSNKITFIETSVDNLDTVFKENMFDIIFANRVFHHFVRESWKETVCGMKSIMGKIYKTLKQDGHLCIVDHFFDGMLFDKISSKLVYTISSCTFKPILAISKRIGVESAGIGVCFLSYNMWIELLRENNFIIERLKRTDNERMKEWYKKICFLNRRNTLDNIMVCKKI
jgi:ubiquinone/menaquinone biosynthesis C-methylase UbiE